MARRKRSWQREAPPTPPLPSSCRNRATSVRGTCRKPRPRQMCCGTYPNHCVRRPRSAAHATLGPTARFRLAYSTHAHCELPPRSPPSFVGGRPPRSPERDCSMARRRENRGSKHTAPRATHRQQPAAVVEVVRGVVVRRPPEHLSWGVWARVIVGHI
jgi:hypothetical protein